MPAPASKSLWQATGREHWQYLYNCWLNTWEECGYLQGEFAIIKPGIKLDPRAEMWLEEADEFGMLFISIGKTSPTS
jgi:hypothetical protein